MALDYREVTLTQAAKIIGCSRDSVRTLVERGQIGVMRYLPRGRDGGISKMLSHEDVELVAEQRRFNAFGMEYRGVVVYGRDEELTYAASSNLGIAGFRVDVCTTALAALSCVRNDERPILVECEQSEADARIMQSIGCTYDCYPFRKPEELRPLVRWAWVKVKARHEALKYPEYSADT